MLRINALGSFTVIGDDGPLAGAVTQPRRAAVLALIARYGERGIARDKILGYLWPDADEEHGRRLLTKALSALRRDLGAEDALLGLADLRVNPAVVGGDVVEFETAIAEGHLERAANLYKGPFLDGFRLPGAAEFDRWVETERAALAHEYAVALERLAQQAESRGDDAAAVRWWRKLAAQDPLHARYAVGLIKALVGAGDRSGALQHARVYEALIEQELDLPPDREVVALAQRIRREAEESSLALAGSPASIPAATARAVTREPAATRVPMPAPADVMREAGRYDAPVASPPTSRESASAPVAPQSSASSQSPTLARRRWIAAAAVTAAVLGLAALTARASRRPADASSATPVVALGHISEYRAGASTRGDVLPLTDMLATNLARAAGLRVVSNARMYELLAQLGAARDSAASVMVAARRAGATELVDGALYDLGEGRLRLDLRRIDLESGAVRGALSVTGSDAFALADSGTARLVEVFGVAPPAGSVADVTTHSLVAYRLYEEGLRSFYRNEYEAADRLFGEALQADSTFAMAAFYHAMVSAPSNLETNALQPRFRRAVRLAERASERERLIIRGAWAATSSSPESRVYAESLVTRYPDEVTGHLYLGRSLTVDGDHLAAIPHFRRAIELDAHSLQGATARCVACEAFVELIHVYGAVDSLDAAEREARRWTRVQPNSASAWNELSIVLAVQGRKREMLDALGQAERVGTANAGDLGGSLVALLIALGDYEEADSILRGHIASGSPSDRDAAYWYLAISLRNQGRLTDALDAARKRRAADRSRLSRGAAPYVAYGEAQVLFEMGRPREAAALFDSISRAPDPFDEPSHVARRRVWALTHVATALAATGDTAALAPIADTIQVLGPRSGLGRDRRLHHHVRGLLLAARGRDDEAIAELSRAIVSPTHGYTRTNYELAKLYFRRGRPRDAVATLQPALRGSIEASNFFLMRTEAHELLARAWEQAGRRDSAAAHYRAVARAWAKSDPLFAARAADARGRLAALGSGR